MAKPDVILKILDGALGILPTLAGGIPAVVGYTTKGALNTPTPHASASALRAEFGDQGIAVEYACYSIEYTGRPVVFIRVDKATDGSYGTLNDDLVTGTSVITVDATVKPNDEYDFVFLVTKGGTIGTSGILYQYSLDGGRSFSPEAALGTANTLTITSANIRIAFAAGTLILGDTATVRTEAPIWDATTLQAGLDALKNSTLAWEFVAVCGKATATDAGNLNAFLTALETTSKKYRWGICNTRRPNEGESEATYLSSLSTAFASFSSVYVSVCAGYAKTLSSVSRRLPKRPVMISVGTRATDVPIQTSLAQVDLGPLPGVSLPDTKGNPDDHDESLNPGLDDARFTVLRTFEGFSGAYVNLPRIMSGVTSDFQRIHLRRVINAAATALRVALVERLHKPVRIDGTTGYILEQDAKDIETAAYSALRDAVLSSGAASSASFVLSRTDNLLSTSTLNGEARVVPLGYPEFILVNLAFENPALITV